MSALYYSSCYFTKTVGIGGTVNFSIKVPGTYAGFNPADPTGAGRYFKRVEIWGGSPAVGDSLTSLKLTDTDSVMGVEKAAFPNYPDLAMLYETSTPSGCTSGVLIPPAGSTSPLIIEQFDTSGNLSLRFLPAQLYLTGTFTGSPTAVFNCNIVWGRWDTP